MCSAAAAAGHKSSMIQGYIGSKFQSTMCYVHLHLTYILQEIHIYLFCICYCVKTRIYRLFNGMIYLRKYCNMGQQHDTVFSDVHCSN